MVLFRYHFRKRKVFKEGLLHSYLVMEKKGWKVTAIIFIIMSLLLFSFIAWAYSYGTSVERAKGYCAVNVCGEYDSFYYDSADGLCYCFTAGEVAYKEYIVK